MIIWSWVKGFFNNLLRFFWDFAKEALAGAKEIVLAELTPFALSVVTELANSSLAGPDKRKKAFSKIKSHAKTVGIKVGDSLVNYLIELCVQSLKGDKE